MTEATLVGALIGALKKEMPGCCVLKHNDGSTAGIPDLSVTYRGRTAWIEVKFTRPGSPGRISELQRLTLRRLDGWLLWYAINADGEQLTKLLTTDGREMVIDGFAHADVAYAIRKGLERQ
jgi:hypothetical protein